MNSNYKRKYTWNNFKAKVLRMTPQEQKEFLSQLQQEYMTERTKTKRGLDANNLKLYRRQIAFIKTLMNIPGYHYHPRG
jgi:ribosomal protein L29